MDVLEIDQLTVTMRRSGVALVDGVSFTVAAGETVGLVGESGSGKSLTCRAALGLLPPALRADGTIRVEGKDLMTLTQRQLRAVRGTSIGMIFQEPMASLNPVLTIGTQLGEAIRHTGVTERAAVRRRSRELLDLVGIGNAERRLDQYPMEFSGGMSQRAMIAIALAGSPRILVADEPTTALDVTIQAQILDLLAGLTDELGMALLLVSHDLGVIAQACRRTMVMYGGRVVESGLTEQVLGRPRHPYTEALLGALPRMTGPKGALAPIPGTVPTAEAMPAGCRFHPRCPLRTDECLTEVPPLAGDDEQAIACWVRGVER